MLLTAIKDITLVFCLLILAGVALLDAMEVNARECAAAYTINGITQMDGAGASKELLGLVDKCNKKFSEGDL